jgi:hypothetical protein
MSTLTLIYVIGFFVILCIGITLWIVISDETLRKLNLYQFVEDEDETGRGILISFGVALFWPIVIPGGIFALILYFIIEYLINIKKRAQNNNIEGKIKSLWNKNSK